MTRRIAKKIMNNGLIGGGCSYPVDTIQKAMVVLNMPYLTIVGKNTLYISHNSCVNKITSSKFIQNWLKN